MKRALIIALAGLTIGCSANGGYIGNCDTDSDCEEKYGVAFLEPFQDARLIGRKCGPEKVTLWAIEEDEFPFSGCKSIKEL